MMSQKYDSKELGAENTDKIDEDEVLAIKETSVRTRSLTKMGNDYQLQKLQKSFSASKSRISRQCQLLSQTIETQIYNAVEQELFNLDKCFAEAEQKHLELIELLPEGQESDQ